MSKFVRLIDRIISAHVLGRLAVAISLCMGCASAVATSAKDPAASSTVHQEVQTDVDSHVKTSIMAISEAPSRKVKIERAQELSQWVSRHPNDVSATDIDLLANLLSDDEDSVRLWIAGALGQLGDKAKNAVPQLQKALQERPCENTPATSAGALRLALSRIGVKPINAVCTKPFGTQ